MRSPMHVIEAAKLGAHVATVPPAVLRSAVQPSADRQGPGGLPRRLGEDRASRSPDAPRLSRRHGMQRSGRRRGCTTEPTARRRVPARPSGLAGRASRTVSRAGPAGAGAWRGAGRPHGGDAAGRARPCRGDGGARRRRAGRRPRRRGPGGAGAGGGAGADARRRSGWSASAARCRASWRSMRRICASRRSMPGAAGCRRARSRGCWTGAGAVPRRARRRAAAARRGGRPGAARRAGARARRRAAGAAGAG